MFILFVTVVRPLIKRGRDNDKDEITEVSLKGRDCNGLNEWIRYIL